MAWNSALQVYCLVSLQIWAHFSSCLGAETTGVLHISTLTENSVEGEYRESATSKRGIRFVSSPDTLAITTLDGVPLLIADEPQAEGSLRVVSIAGDTFVQHRSISNEAGESTTDYAVPAAWKNKIKGAHSNLNAYVRSLERMAAEPHSINTLERSIQTLLMQPETELLKPAAFALGAQGITGKEFPGILPFYLAAMQLQKLSTRNDEGGKKLFSPHQWYQHKRLRRAACLWQCPPCPNDECLGMCGYGCTCWEFLCDDCCYHLGCYEHDLCCREQFAQTRCLIPFGFKCGSPYRCS